MKKSIFLAAVALSAAPILSSAQTITHLQDIPVNGFVTLPGGITVDDEGNAFVVGFNTKRVVKVTGAVTSAPSAAILARTEDTDTGPEQVTTMDWIANSGLVTANWRSPNQLIIAGDSFENDTDNSNQPNRDGFLAILDSDTGALLDQMDAYIGGSARRIASADFFDADTVIGAIQAGTNYFQLPATLDAVAFYNGPDPSASRDIKVFGTSGEPTVYIAFNTFGTGAVGIHRILPGGDPGVFTDNTNQDNWYTATLTTNQRSIQGIDVFTYTPTVGSPVTFAALATGGDAQVRLVDTSNTANVINLVDASMTRVNDVVFYTAGNGDQYMLISQTDTDTPNTGGFGPNGRVSVYGIDGATLGSSVENWNLY